MKNNLLFQNESGILSPSQYFFICEEEKKQLRKQSTRAGVCIVAFFVLRFVISLIIGISPALSTAYFSESSLSFVLEMTVYLLIMFVPFFTAYLLMPENEKNDTDSFGKPISALSGVTAVISGLLFCAVGNIVTTYFITFLSIFGIELTGGEYSVTASPEGLIFQLINIAVLPALIEEFALRFIVMQPLRRYGDTFAVVMSAVIFSLMHGNLIQIPFAFIVGIAIGFFVIQTGSIWVGILIHFLNNAFSVLNTYFLTVKPSFATHFYSLFTAISIVTGITALAVFLTLCKRNRFNNGYRIMSKGSLAGAYMTTPPMIIAILLIVFSTMEFVAFSGE